MGSRNSSLTERRKRKTSIAEALDVHRANQNQFEPLDGSLGCSLQFWGQGVANASGMYCIRQIEVLVKGKRF